MLINNSSVIHLGKPSDGPISQLINRKVSGFITIHLGTHVAPKYARWVVLLLGILSAVSYMHQSWLMGGILFQFSSIFSGVDGEIARMRNLCTPWGDFCDTITDRFVEYGAILGMSYGLYQLFGIQSLWIGLLLLGGTLMLTTASEKFRSLNQKNYLKRKFEGFFAWISSGRDARIFWLGAASLFSLFSPWVVFGAMGGLALVVHVNFLFRVFVMRGKLKTEVDDM